MIFIYILYSRLSFSTCLNLIIPLNLLLLHPFVFVFVFKSVFCLHIGAEWESLNMNNRLRDFPDLYNNYITFEAARLAEVINDMELQEVFPTESDSESYLCRIRCGNSSFANLIFDDYENRKLLEIVSTCHFDEAKGQFIGGVLPFEFFSTN